MGQIFNNVNADIMAAMKSGDTTRSNALRDLKNELLKFKTSKEGAKACAENGGEIADAKELSILKKMVNELKADAQIFEDNGRKDLAVPRLEEADILSEMLPQEASEEDIRKEIEKFIASVGEFTKKEMGNCIKHVKSVLTNADGKLVSQVVMSYL